MEQLYSVKRVVYLSTALLFLFILSTLIYSCRKELKIVPLSAADSVDAARSWYEATYPVNNALSVNNKTTTLGVNSTGSTQFDFSQNIKPDWTHTGKYKRFGKDVIEMPVDPGKVLYYSLKNANTGQYTSAKENSKAWFLLLNDGKAYTAYVMVLIGDPSYINGDPSRLAKNSYRKRDANFSGMLLYFTPKGKFLRSYKYVNGTIVTGNNQTSAANTKQTQSTGKTVNKAASYDCTDWYWVTRDGDGNVVSQDYAYTICFEDTGGGGDDPGDGGGGSPPPCQVTNSVAQKAVNVAQPPPPDPGDGGGNDPGYPDPTPVQGSTCSQSSTPDTTKNPCTEVGVVNSRAADPMVATANSVLLSTLPTNNEYGVSLATPNWNGGAYNQPALNTNNLPNYVNQGFTWNSNDGYVIALIHSHPRSGNAPSPADVINLYNILATSTDLQAAGADQIQYYKNNVSTTAISTTGSYMATVHDWGALQNFYNDFKNSTPDANGYRPIENQYLQLMDTYQRNNPTANSAEASAYALMTVMGSSINLYYASPNTTSFNPMAVGSSGIVGPKNCN